MPQESDCPFLLYRSRNWEDHAGILVPPACVWTCRGLYRSLSPGSTTSPVHLTPLSKEEADVLQSRGSEPESRPGLNTQHAPVQGSQSAPRLGKTPGSSLLLPAMP